MWYWKKKKLSCDEVLLSFWLAHMLKIFSIPWILIWILIMGLAHLISIQQRHNNSLDDPMNSTSTEQRLLICFRKQKIDTSTTKHLIIWKRPRRANFVLDPFKPFNFPFYTWKLVMVNFISLTHLMVTYLFTWLVWKWRKTTVIELEIS